MGTRVAAERTLDGPVNATSGGGGDDDDDDGDDGGVLPVVDDGRPKSLDVPVDYCYPLDAAGRILIGAYPRDADDVRALVAIGVGRFVNLTADRLYEQWQCCDDLRGGAVVDFCHAPLPRRDNVASDARVLAICRDIQQWLDAHGADARNRIYVHSELGHGRAGLVAAVLVGDLECVQTNRAIARVEQRRAMWRADCAGRRRRGVAPTPETNAQVEQVFRLLGNPQRASVERDDADGIRSTSSARASAASASSSLSSGGAKFVDLAVASAAAATDDGGRGIGGGGGGGGGGDKDTWGTDECDYVALPDRSDRSWRFDADELIKQRKRARKRYTTACQAGANGDDDDNGCNDNNDGCNGNGTKRRRVAAPTTMTTA